MKVFIGADHNGFTMKRQLVEYLQRQGYEVIDTGDTAFDADDDYPQFAAKLVMAMQATPGNDARGILLCGSGQGVCIAANRFKGIRAAVCDDTASARSGRNDDDTNVLCLPARMIDEGKAESVVKVWLETGFAGAARFKRRIAQLDELG